jgi:outer membrane immunogenic protein
MRKFTLTLLATTAAVGLVVGQATAADLPRKAPPPMVAPPPPLWNWTGLYVVGHFGMGISRDQFSEGQLADDPNHWSWNFDPATYLGSHNAVGPLGGVTLGYNYQFANSPIVLGIEGQFSFANLQGDHQNTASRTSTYAFDHGSDAILVTQDWNVQERFFSRVKDVATIAARLGVTSGPQDRTLWYVKGGGAWAKTAYALDGSASALRTRFETDSDGTDVFTKATNFQDALSGTKSRWGWMVGTGVEWGLIGNWSAKIEYDYLDFGSYNVTLNGFRSIQVAKAQIDDGNADKDKFTKSKDISRNLSVDQQMHIVKIGLNYRFDWGRY